MKRVNCILVAVLSVIVAACASSPVADTFYSLVLAADETGAEFPENNKRDIVIVGPVELPSYLNQRGLVIQTGHNRIQTANHHLWAEPLDAAIAKVLVRDLTKISGSLIAEREAGRWTATARCRLRFEFDHFHATSSSGVVVGGRYWLLSEKATVSREFDLKHVLSEDGYSTAVAMLRQSLRELAQDVAETLQENAHCANSAV